MDYPKKIINPGSCFEDYKVFTQNSAMVNPQSEKLTYSGTVMSSFGDSVATASDELHTFIVGESGCGKSRRIVMPTIRLTAKTGRSLVISDPKGEIYHSSAKYLKEHGYSVHVMNLRNPLKGDQWNPLSYIYDLYYSKDVFLKERACIMLKDLVENLKQNIKSEKDKFWENSAGNVILGIAQALLEIGEKDSFTFSNIIYNLNCLDNAELRKDFRKIDSNIDYINNIKTTCLDESSTTCQCILSEARTMISPFASQNSILQMLDKSSFDIEEIGQHSTALFLILPDDSVSLYPVATLLVKQIYSILLYLADSNKNGKLTNPVSFILDEFANFAVLPGFDSILTAARSRKITFTLVCQSMEQLFLKYGKEGAEIIMSNCRVWLYMNCRNNYFIERLQYLMGDYVSPYNGERRPLVSVQDLQHFKMGQILIFNDRCKPFMGFVKDISEYNFNEKDQTMSSLKCRKSEEPKIFKVIEEILKNYMKNTVDSDVSEGAPF